MSAALDRKLREAAAALAQGDLARAERVCREVLDRAPRHPRALEVAAAVRLQQEDGAGAGELLQRALAGDPDNPRLLEGLGAAALKAGKFTEAEAWLRRAMSLGKSGAAGLCWLGIAVSSQGRHPEAVEIFRRAAAAQPDSPHMHLNLAHELMRAGVREEAIAAYERALALEPESPEALNSLGSALREQGRLEDSVARFQQALALRPDYAEALDNLGNALARLEKMEEAAACFRRAVLIEPDNADFHADLGDALCAQDLWDEAVAQYERALRVRPDDPEVLNSLGSALQERGTSDEAIAPLQRAIALRPTHGEAHRNLARALLQQGREEEGTACFREAVALEPGNAELRVDFAAALLDLHRWDEAIAELEAALSLRPELSANVQFGRAMVQLFRQEFGRAWAGHERRLEAKTFRKRSLRKDAKSVALFEQLRRWRGPAETGVGEVALWAEQGIGDQVLFSTLIPELVGTGVGIVYEVDRRLLDAYARAFPQVRFVALADPPHEALQRADRVLAIGSLPGLFRRSREDFVRQPAKLLGALPERVALYRERLQALAPGSKVALSWRSTRNDYLGRRKTATLGNFVPLLGVNGVQFVDVQYGDTSAERATVEADSGARLLRFEEVDYYNDLEELLAILDACDLVITTSNATAHFAGALGKRAWLLYLEDKAPFHYWAHGGDYRCLWYPSVEIVSSTELTDWASLIEHTAARLAQLQAGAAAQKEGGGAIAVSETEGKGPAPVVEKARTVPERPDKALGLLPGDAGQWRELGVQLRQQGKLAEAVDACRRAVDLSPGDARAWTELAHALRWLGRLSEARSATARAIEIAPELASAWFNLGAVQVAQADAARGIEAYRKALELKPDFPEAWSNLGEALGANGDRAGELAAYRRAIAINPRLAPVWSNLGNALLEAGEIEEAVAACRRATEIDPGFAVAWNNLGNALRQHGGHAEAIRACERALRLSPRFAEAWSNFGSALLEQGEIEKSFAAHQRALQIEPRDARAHYNLGIAQERSRQYEAAVASYRRAVALDPAFTPAWMRLACVLLMRGEFPEGWSLYEWRWRERKAPPRRFDFTPWAGELVPGRKLLLWGEQGIGDEIIYSSMIGELAAGRLRITLEIDPRLAPLMRRSFPGVTVVARTEPASVVPAAFDCQSPLASLGRWLRPSFDAFPEHAGYLKADAERVERFAARLRRPGATKVVGISWGSANREFGAEKSTALTDWGELLRVPGIQFVDLQYGDTAGEREELRRRHGPCLTHLDDVDLFNDLEAVAALCAACDLVITVSNVTAHMAGALGRPVWLLAPIANGRIWYWFSGRDDSPWYPSMRIFTQHAPGSWREVLETVGQQLAGFEKG